VACVNEFIESHGIRTVVDLGCGDFRVGRGIAQGPIKYVGVDIVEPLVLTNQARFGTDRVQFQCLDIITDEIPNGDLCLVREVFQHLSNVQISAILDKLRRFKWIIVTEVQPGQLGSFKPNRDKPHGVDSRVVMWNSGIVLSAPPFNISGVELLLTVPAAQKNAPDETCISTVLIRN
jgi:SAM-dependent methyltransferase